MITWATVAEEAGLPVAAGPAVSGGVINLYLAGKLCNNDIWHSAQHQPDTHDTRAQENWGEN